MPLLVRAHSIAAGVILLTQIFPKGCERRVRGQNDIAMLITDEIQMHRAAQFFITGKSVQGSGV